jgi:hypothetical protein
MGQWKGEKMLLYMEWGLSILGDGEGVSLKEQPE